jgi:hypothetical protein
LFRFIPGKNWPVGIQQAIHAMRIKLPTTTWSSRHKTQIAEKSGHEIKEAYFGSVMIDHAKASKAVARLPNVQGDIYINNMNN